MSFVIVAYNSRETIAECIDSVLGQTTAPLEVIVVDNASVDGTLEFVKSEFPGTICISNEHNLGYGAANNIGAGTAHGELVAFVNPDVALEPSWSAEILNALRDDRRCAAAEGKLLLADKPGFINCGGSSINVLGFGCMTHYNEPAEAASEGKLVGYASGAAFAIRRNVFLRLGGFDGSYFLYHEDVDLGLRVHGAGWKIRYEPKAVAHHHYKSVLSASKVRFLERNRWKTLAKNMPQRYLVVCGPLLVVSELGLIYNLATLGLFHSKARATLDFLCGLSDTMRARKSVRNLTAERRSLMELLTDEFPQILPPKSRSTHLGRRLVRAYYTAFFRGGAKN